MLLDNRQIDRVADIVSGEDFSDPFFRQVFELACMNGRLAMLSTRHRFAARSRVTTRPSCSLR
jgi:hypothetical protein